MSVAYGAIADAQKLSMLLALVAENRGKGAVMSWAPAFHCLGSSPQAGDLEGARSNPAIRYGMLRDRNRNWSGQ